MKANELMIGDWIQTKEVCTNDNFLPSYKRQVAQIKDNGVELSYTDRYGNKCYITLLYDDIEPIPLTAEILERNGFKEISGDDDIYQLEEKPFWFWVDFMNHQYGCEFDTSTYECESSEHRLKLYGIPSVNELQHALKLCGIDKTIEL